MDAVHDPNIRKGESHVRGRQVGWGAQKIVRGAHIFFFEKNILSEGGPVYLLLLVENLFQHRHIRHGIHNYRPQHDNAVIR